MLTALLLCRLLALLGISEGMHATAGKTTCEGVQTAWAGMRGHEMACEGVRSMSVHMGACTRIRASAFM